MHAEPRSAVQGPTAQERATAALEQARAAAADAAQARADAAQARAEAAAQRGAPGSVVNVDDGTMIATSPDGRTTTITEPGGKTTTIITNEDGQVTISTNGGEAVTLPQGMPWTDALRRLAERHEAIAEVPSHAPPPFERDEIPDGVLALIGMIFGIIAMTIVGLPIARAFARRMDHRNAAPPAAAAGPEVATRLDRIEQAIETIAVEVERVAEAQRYSARLLTERLPESPARAIAAEHAR